MTYNINIKFTRIYYTQNLKTNAIVINRTVLKGIVFPELLGDDEFLIVVGDVTWFTVDVRAWVDMVCGREVCVESAAVVNVTVVWAVVPFKQVPTNKTT